MQFVAIYHLLLPECIGLNWNGMGLDDPVLSIAEDDPARNGLGVGRDHSGYSPIRKRDRSHRRKL